MENFEIEVGNKVTLVVIPDESAKLEIVKTVIRETNGDVQLIGTGKPYEIGLVAARIGRSILIVEFSAKNEFGGIEVLKRELNVVVKPVDDDLLSLYLVPATEAQKQLFLAPESTNEALGIENADLRAQLEEATKRADELQELVDQFNQREQFLVHDVGTTSDSENLPPKIEDEVKPKKPGNLAKTTKQKNTAPPDTTSVNAPDESPKAPQDDLKSAETPAETLDKPETKTE